MKNILLWAGIAILAFQDYFKQQPVKPTRRQQFLQTGETSQAFVEGTKLEHRKQLQKYFGKPTSNYKDISFNGYKYTVYEWNFKFFKIQFDQYNSKIIIDALSIIADKKLISYTVIRKNDGTEDLEYSVSKIVRKMFDYLANIPESTNEYSMLNDIAKAGDWELALEIAKGQGLL